MYTLKNDLLEVKVTSAGAQIMSIVKEGIEMMWQRDEKYWGKTSPVLFPFVGKLKDDKYEALGQKVNMTQHGFARDRNFDVELATDHQLIFSYESVESDLAIYPYSFVFKIEYILVGSKLTTNYYIENRSDDVMPFQVGAHPAFNVNNVDELSFVFPEQVANEHYFAEGLQTDTKQIRLSTIDLGYDIINDNLPCFSNMEKRSGTLIKNGLSFINFEFDSMTHIAFWSPEFKNAPFICVEPWLGICSRTDQVSYDLTDKDAMTKLAPKSKMNCGYSFEFCN